MTSFSIVIPAWNALHYLRRTLPSVLKAVDRHGDAAVLLVDNGSTDGTAEYVSDHYPRVQVLSIPRQTIGAARNQGARNVDGETLVFLDADCLMNPEHLVQAEHALERAGTRVTGSSYELPEAPGWIEKSWYLLHKRPRDGWTHLIPAGNLVVTRKAFDEVGGFDEALITGEDAELCQRLMSAGHQPFASRSVRVAHLGNPKDLAGFFRRNVWHAIGMFATARRGLDRPLLMSTAHLLLAFLSLVALGVGRFSPASIAAFLVLQLTVPTLTVAYRLVSKGGGVSSTNAVQVIPGSILLYWVYYWARIRALFVVLAGRGSEYRK